MGLFDEISDEEDIKEDNEIGKGDFFGHIKDSSFSTFKSVIEKIEIDKIKEWKLIEYYAKINSIECMEYLLSISKEINIAERGKNQKNLIFLAIKSKNNCKVEFIKYLQQKNVNIEEYDNNFTEGRVIHLAAKMGLIEVMEYLLSIGIFNVNEFTVDKINNPLSIALLSKETNLEFIKFLISKGATFPDLISINNNNNNINNNNNNKNNNLNDNNENNLNNNKNNNNNNNNDNVSENCNNKNNLNINNSNNNNNNNIFEDDIFSGDDFINKNNSKENNNKKILDFLTKNVSENDIFSENYDNNINDIKNKKILENDIFSGNFGDFINNDKNNNNINNNNINDINNDINNDNNNYIEKIVLINNNLRNENYNLINNYKNNNIKFQTKFVQKLLISTNKNEKEILEIIKYLLSIGLDDKNLFIFSINTYNRTTNFLKDLISLNVNLKYENEDLILKHLSVIDLFYENFQIETLDLLLNIGCKIIHQNRFIYLNHFKDRVGSLFDIFPNIRLNKKIKFYFTLFLTNNNNNNYNNNNNNNENNNNNSENNNNIIEKNKQFFVVNKEGESVLQYISRLWDSDFTWDMIKYLLKKGAPVDMKSINSIVPTNNISMERWNIAKYLVIRSFDLDHCDINNNLNNHKNNCKNNMEERKRNWKKSFEEKVLGRDLYWENTFYWLKPDFSPKIANIFSIFGDDSD